MVHDLPPEIMCTRSSISGATSMEPDQRQIWFSNYIYQSRIPETLNSCTSQTLRAASVSLRAEHGKAVTQSELTPVPSKAVPHSTWPVCPDAAKVPTATGFVHIPYSAGSPLPVLLLSCPCYLKVQTCPTTAQVSIVTTGGPQSQKFRT